VVIFPFAFHIAVQQPSHAVPLLSVNKEHRTRQHGKEHQFKLEFV